MRVHIEDHGVYTYTFYSVLRVHQNTSDQLETKFLQCRIIFGVEESNARAPKVFEAENVT